MDEALGCLGDGALRFRLRIKICRGYGFGASERRVRWLEAQSFSCSLQVATRIELSIGALITTNNILGIPIIIIV